MAKRTKEILASIPDKHLYKGAAKDKLTFYKGQGCGKCGSTGYSGRISISEVIENTKQMQDIIAKGFDRALADKELANQGFLPMASDGIMKVMLGMTTVDEVIMATKE